ncbi:NAD(P)-dependent oxidoreductase [Aciditerrimonas ferrireducens]|uniref:NAD(P)-dependent oxidoreductase n=1 Tax=Aciditerrimonas ferrireducens TaxID=667306 RepID=A0ABV6C2H4_9ACTN
MAASSPFARHRALVTAPLRGPALGVLEELAELVLEPWIEQRPLRLSGDAELAERVAEAQADLLVVEADQCGPAVFEQPLRAVAVTRGEPTNVDLAAASAAGVPVLHTPGRNADAVAELTVGLLLACTRRLVVGDRELRQGQVFAGGTIPYQRHRSWELAGRTVGLVGLGAVGRAVRWRLRGLGMEVLASDPAVPEAPLGLEELLARSDVVSVHAALTPQTAGMIDARAFAAMRPGAVYLNTARAQLQDTEALVAALASGHLGACGLDHVEGEQLPPDHPLLRFDQVVLSPHIGGATYDTEVRQTAMVAEGLCQLLAGATPPTCLNPEVLGRPRNPAGR